jgi:hypothetical protein
MPEFNNIEEAFRWWIEHIYPKLAKEDKAKMKYFVYNFKKNRSLTTDKMHEILAKYSQLQIIVKIEEK